MCSLSFDLLEEARDTKVKGSGQECPLHTSLFYDGSTPFLRVFFRHSWRRLRERRGSTHYFLKCRLELLHFIMRADRDANTRRHDGPNASDINFLLCHGVDHFFAWTFRIEQEAIRLGRNIGISVALKPLKSFLTDAGVDASALRNQIWIFQARCSRNQSGDGHEVPSGALHNFVQQFWTGDG